MTRLTACARISSISTWTFELFRARWISDGQYGFWRQCAASSSPAVRGNSRPSQSRWSRCAMLFAEGMVMSLEEERFSPSMHFILQRGRAEASYFLVSTTNGQLPWSCWLWLWHMCSSTMRRGHGSLSRKQITPITDDLRDDSTVDVEGVVNVFSNAPSPTGGRGGAWTGE